MPMVCTPVTTDTASFITATDANHLSLERIGDHIISLQGRPHSRQRCFVCMFLSDRYQTKCIIEAQWKPMVDLASKMKVWENMIQRYRKVPYSVDCQSSFHRQLSNQMKRGYLYHRAPWVPSQPPRSNRPPSIRYQGDLSRPKFGNNQDAIIMCEC